MDVKMPDGTIVKNVPEGTTKQQLMEKLGQVPAEATPSPQVAAPAPEATPMPMLDEPGFFEAFGRASLARMLNNAIGAADLVPNPFALIPGAPQRPPRPSAEDIAGLTNATLAVPGAVVAGEPVNFTQRVEQAQAAEAATSRRFGEQAPVATATGHAAGDIASLLALRAPIRAPLTAATMPSKAALTVESTLGKALQATARAARPALARAAETGGEAAVLAAIQGNDPETVGAIAAGIQGGNDLVAGGVKRLLKSPGIAGGIGGAVLTASILSNGFQGITPGGLNHILPTIEQHSKEAVIALLTSGLGQAALGRFGPKAFSAGKAGPVVSEIANVVRRGALVSGLNAMVAKPDTVVPVANAFAEDPDYFGPKARRQLQRAFNGKADLGKTVDNLMKDRAFKKKLDALTAPPG